MRGKCFAVLLWAPFTVAGQARPDMQAIMERLDRLEEQNRQLMTEIRSLRQQLQPAPATTGATPGAQPTPSASEPVGERESIVEHRLEELDQSKVGAEQRLPLSLTGTVLFNAFLNGRYSGGQMNPVVAVPSAGPAAGGASMRQTVLGVKFQGPTVFGGGKVNGTLFLDLFAGSGTSLNQLARLRVATVDVAWKNTTVSVGQDKPIIAPREPDSLAQVGVSPLTGAGNLWLWQPQVRVEQRFAFGDNSGLRAQAGIFQTSESSTGISQEFQPFLSPAEPGYEGRFEWWLGKEGRRIEIAPSFHVSTTHLLGHSVPSRVYSVDWLIRPFTNFDFSGQFFQGENVDVLGGLRQSVRVLPNNVIPIHAQGGWGQLTFRATPRLTFHLYGGQQADRASELTTGFISRNIIYAGNLMYRLGSNVIASAEVSQARTTYVGPGTRLNPHYDLALAYLF